MATNVMPRVLDRLRRAVLLGDGENLTDGQLLDSFVRTNDEAAFAALVRRHGPMVLGVCRRVLRNLHDAEDAFQATFLVLVRKAGSVVPGDQVAHWLYGVAYRTALKARTLLARHRERERLVTEMPEPETAEHEDRWRDLQPLLDQELSRLPDKYRIPIVLCDLEGKTGKDAARQLGWPEGTVASRLSRGRNTLARRLTRQGLLLSAGSLVALVTRNAATASVPASLTSSTVKASTLAADSAAAAGLISAGVAALVEGVMKAMFLNKLRIMFVMLAVVVTVGIGLGGGTFRAAAEVESAVQPPRMSQPGQDRTERLAKQTANEKKQAEQILDMVLKGFRAHQDSTGGRPTKDPQDLNREAFLTAFQIAQKIARAKGKAQAKDASDTYGEAFLKAFQIASEVARAKGTVKATVRQEERGPLAAPAKAFVQAYEQAQLLKAILAEEQASNGKAGKKTREALDRFLKAGKGFDQTIKSAAKAQAVEQALRGINDALRQVGQTAHDRRTTLETLAEIERAVQDLRRKLQEQNEEK